MRSIILITIAAGLIAVPLPASAVPTATITVPEEGGHYYWFSYTDVNGRQVTTTPQRFEDKKTTVDLPVVKDAVPECSLFVLDASTGNEAVVSVEGKPGEALKFDLKSSDFDRVRRVKVLVTSASTGESAAAGIVELTDADGKTQTQVLDPSAGGVAEFTDVAGGTANVKVDCGEAKAQHEVKVPLDREELVLGIEAPVVGDIETVEAAAPAGGGAAAAPAEGAKGRSPINPATALIGLVLLIGILYAAYIALRNRGVGTRQVLGKLGIELPEEPQAAAPAKPEAAPVDPSVCPFCGSKKDPNTGACACSVGGAPAPGVAGESSGPRLIGTQGVYAGTIYALEGDTVTMGREESNTIAFPQDSTSSRKHARITKTNGEFTVHDEGSSNGTFVNGVKVTEQVLKPGDEIQVGSTKLRFEV